MSVSPERARTGASRPLLLLLSAAALVAVLPAAGPAHTGARFYRGEIAVPSSWDGVVRLTGTVVIREGVTVTVEPGTEVLVQPGVGAEIVVRGRLLARGTAERPVIFESAGGCGSGAWGGIVFEKGSSGILENARIRCSARGVSGDLTGVAGGGALVEPGR